MAERATAAPNSHIPYSPDCGDIKAKTHANVKANKPLLCLWRTHTQETWKWEAMKRYPVRHILWISNSQRVNSLHVHGLAPEEALENSRSRARMAEMPLATSSGNIKSAARVFC